MSAYGVSTCEDHDDCIVIYAGKKCPVCQNAEDTQGEIQDLKDRIEDTEKVIERLKEEVKA